MSAMILEKPKSISKQIEHSPSFYSEEDYLQVENIQESCQSCQKWTSQQIHPKVRP